MGIKEPPELINGNGIPKTGIKPIATPIYNNSKLLCSQLFLKLCIHVEEIFDFTATFIIKTNKSKE